MAKEEEFAVLVALFPGLHDLEHYQGMPFHDAVKNRAADAGFAFLDLLPAFIRASGGNERLLRGRCKREHPDEKGHASAAAEIERVIREGLLDS